MPIQLLTIRTAVAVILVPAATLYAQNMGASENDPWIGVVVTESASIHCGANESYYPVAIAHKGDLVEVHGKRQDWLKITTTGSVFADVVGYVKFPSKDTSVLSVTGDNGLVLREVEVLAKNIDSDELYRSWRPVLRLHSDAAVRILDSTITEPGTLHRESYVVHTVQMPTTATVWINTTSILPATKEQAVQFQESVATGFVKLNTPAELVDALPDTDPVVESNTTGKDSANGKGLITEQVADSSIIPNESNAEKLVLLSIAELEAAWEKLTKDPVMGAEVSPMRDMYTELLEAHGDDLVVHRIATGRIKQLDIWSGLQQQRIRIEELRVDLDQKTKKVGEFQEVVAMYEGYAVMGRLALSNTFDGRLRPLMFRVQDLHSGRTLGYLPATKDWELSGLIGQTVGVTGVNSWDPTWRVNVVKAKRFDILSPTTATVPTDIQ